MPEPGRGEQEMDEHGKEVSNIWSKQKALHWCGVGWGGGGGGYLEEQGHPVLLAFLIEIVKWVNNAS